MSFLSLILPTSVTTKEGKIFINHLKTEPILRQIERVTGTSRIVNNMFDVKRDSLSFYEFFLPDMAYMLDLVINDKHVVRPVKNKCKSLLVLLHENTWLGTLDDPVEPQLDLSRLSKLNYTPLDYQREFLEYYANIVPRLKLRGTLLASFAGSGKSYTSMALAECANADRIIVVSPLVAVIKVWEDNIQKVFVKPQTYWLSTHKVPYAGQRIAVYHYEALGKALEDVPKLMSPRTVVILDESHNLNEVKSQRTINFLEFVKLLKSKDIIFASGTPIKAQSFEAGTLLRAIDPLFTPQVEERFRKAFAGTSTEINKMVNARIGKVSFKVDKTRLDLTKPILYDVPVKIPTGQKYTLDAIRKVMDEFIKERNKYYADRKDEDEAFYKQCLDTYRNSIGNDKIALAAFKRYNDNIATIKKTSSFDFQHIKEELVYCNSFENKMIMPTLNPTDKVRFKDVKSVIKYVALKIQGECLGRILGRMRIDAHIDMAKHIDYRTVIDNAEKKTVIFSTYVEVLDEVVKKLEEMKYKPLSVYGSTTKDLASTVTKFGKDEEYNPLVATFASLSTAVPLIMANTVIMINSPFRAYIQDQAISRVHRLGATTATYVYQTFLDTGDVPNISTRGIDILQWSQTQAEELTGMVNIFKDSTTMTDVGDLTIANESLDISETYKVSPSVIKSILADW